MHVPTFFRALLIQASRRTQVHTSNGILRYDYSVAGHELCRHLEDLVSENAIGRLHEISTDETLVRRWLMANLNPAIPLYHALDVPYSCVGFFKC